MCYGYGCRWEKSFSGECGKPSGAFCPDELDDYDNTMTEYADRLYEEVKDGDRPASSARTAFNRAKKNREI